MVRGKLDKLRRSSRTHGGSSVRTFEAARSKTTQGCTKHGEEFGATEALDSH